MSVIHDFCKQMFVSVFKMCTVFGVFSSFMANKSQKLSNNMSVNTKVKQLEIEKEDKFAVYQ